MRNASEIFRNLLDWHLSTYVLTVPAGPEHWGRAARSPSFPIRIYLRIYLFSPMNVHLHTPFMCRQLWYAGHRSLTTLVACVSESSPTSAIPKADGQMNQTPGAWSVSYPRISMLHVRRPPTRIHGQVKPSKSQEPGCFGTFMYPLYWNNEAFCVWWYMSCEIRIFFQRSNEFYQMYPPRVTKTPSQLAQLQVVWTKHLR